MKLTVLTRLYYSVVVYDTAICKSRNVTMGMCPRYYGSLYYLLQPRSFTLYPAHSRVGRGNVVLRYIQLYICDPAPRYASRWRQLLHSSKLNQGNPENSSFYFWFTLHPAQNGVGRGNLGTNLGT